MRSIAKPQTVVVTPDHRILIDGEAWVRARTAGVNEELTAELRAVGGPHEYAASWEISEYLRRSHTVIAESTSEPGDLPVLTSWLWLAVFERGPERFVAIQVQHPNLKECLPPTVYHTVCDLEAFSTFEYTATCRNGHYFRVSSRRTVEATAGPGARPLNLKNPLHYDLEEEMENSPGRRAVAVCPGCGEHERVQLELEMTAPGTLPAARAGEQVSPALMVQPRDEADAIMVSPRVLHVLATELYIDHLVAQSHTKLIVSDTALVVQHRENEDELIRTTAVPPEADGRYRLSRAWLALAMDRPQAEVEATLNAIAVTCSRKDTAVTTGLAQLWMLPGNRDYVLELPGVTVRVRSGQQPTVAIDTDRPATLQLNGSPATATPGGSEHQHI